METKRIPQTPMYARMAEGHLIRTGHKLVAVHASSDGIVWLTVRLCCGEQVPGEAPTWVDAAPSRFTPADSRGDVWDTNGRTL